MRNSAFSAAVLFIPILCVSQPATAAEGYATITAPEVRKMLDEQKASLVHVLSEIEYDMQHITGSINIPIIDIETTTRLPQDKDRPLIFYCMGVR